MKTTLTILDCDPESPAYGCTVAIRVPVHVPQSELGWSDKHKTLILRIDDSEPDHTYRRTS